MVIIISHQCDCLHPSLPVEDLTFKGAHLLNGLDWFYYIIKVFSDFEADESDQSDPGREK